MGTVASANMETISPVKTKKITHIDLPTKQYIKRSSGNIAPNNKLSPRHGPRPTEKFSLNSRFSIAKLSNKKIMRSKT